MFERSRYTLDQVDPELHEAIRSENQRQEDHIELIASENYTSPAVMAAQGSQLTNKYAEGYCLGLEHEVFAVHYLNAHHALIDAVRHFSGTLMQTSAYPRELSRARCSATPQPSSCFTTTRAEMRNPAGPTST